jgi:hypothetical protein
VVLLRGGVRCSHVSSVLLRCRTLGNGATAPLSPAMIIGTFEITGFWILYIIQYSKKLQNKIFQILEYQMMVEAQNPCNSKNGTQSTEVFGV